MAFGRAGEGVEGGIMVVLVLWAGLLLILTYLEQFPIGVSYFKEERHV